MRSKLMIAVACALTGCASISTPERAAQLEDDQLCRLAYDLPRGGIYGDRQNAVARAEIDRRGLMTADEWTLAEGKLIRRGMSECALLASWGLPSKVNRSVGVWGVHKQYVYRGYRVSWYAYVENGRVTGWQN